MAQPATRNLGRLSEIAQLAVLLVVGLAIAHLAKGLDVEEASLSLLVLAALYRFRKRFDVPGDPLFVRPLVVTTLAFATTAALVVLLDVRGFRGDRIEDVLAAFSLVLGFRTLHLWLRPISQRVRQSAEERRLVRRLVRSHGDDSLAQPASGGLRQAIVTSVGPWRGEGLGLVMAVS